MKKPSNYDAAHQIESLKQECEILHRLRHSYVIELLGVCDHQGMRWPVLAIADQGSLSSYLARYPTVTFDWRIRLCLGCTMAVEYIHSHPSGPVLHHDIKPSNFLLNDEHHVQRIKIGQDATTTSLTHASRRLKLAIDSSSVDISFALLRFTCFCLPACLQPTSASRRRACWTPPPRPSRRTDRARFTTSHQK